MHTSLKLQEATFKAACKLELAGLQVLSAQDISRLQYAPQARVDVLPGFETDERRARLEAKLAVLAAKVIS